MFTVRSDDSAYNSAMTGNGEVVTIVGPKGYHNGLCPAEEAVNRTIFRSIESVRTWGEREPCSSTLVCGPKLVAAS